MNATLSVPSSHKIYVVAEALGPAMLELAGSVSDGTTLWFTGAKTIEQYTIPAIR